MPYDPSDWDTADDTAKDTAQHFFTDANGAHVTETASDPNTGNNVLIDSGGMYVRDGTTNVAQFKNPTIIGKTGAGEPNIYIGTSGAETGLFLRSGTQEVLRMFPENLGGYIQSGDGGYLGIYDGNLYFTPLGQSRFKILDTNNQSGFCIGGVHVYGGSIVKTVTATREITVFSNADTRSTFNVASGKENQIYVNIVNGDYGSQAHRVNSVSYRSNSGWNAYLDGNASAGAFRFGYIAIVPASVSTV